MGECQRGAERWRTNLGLCGKMGVSPIGRVGVGLVAAILAGALASPWLGAQERARIHVAATIAVAAPSEAELGIEVGPPGSAPQKSFLSLRGLPPTVTLSRGQSVGPGSWVVPLASLPGLKANIPAGLSGSSDLIITLIALNGRLLAEARATLAIEPRAMSGSARGTPAVSPAPAEPALPPTPETGPKDVPGGAPPEPPALLKGADRERAERLLEQGEAYLADGNILGARDFFERAADAGLAAAALRMASTYDPVELARLTARGVVPDLTLARKWYERARDLGAAEAAERLLRLGGK